MPTDRQIANRGDNIGSSDIYMLFNRGNRNSHDLFLNKHEGIPLMAGDPDYAKAGRFFEGGLLEWAAGELGPLVRNQERRVKGTPLLIHVDAMVKADDYPVEGKIIGLHGFVDEEWGDGGDDVPERVIFQCHGHMLATDKDKCHVPAFLGRRGFIMFCVPRNEDLAGAIVDRAIAFKKNHLDTGIPPQDVTPSLDIVKQVRREPGKVADIDPALVEEWINTRATRKGAEVYEDEAKAALIAALGDAEASAVLPNGHSVTYREQSRKGLDMAALRDAVPDLDSRFGRPTTFRALREKKPPKGKRGRT